MKTSADEFFRTQRDCPNSLEPAARTPATDSRTAEWLRVDQAVRYFGIGRSTLYTLFAEGAVKTALIRRRGNTTGIRLVSADSLRAYVEAFAAPCNNTEKGVDQ